MDPSEQTAQMEEEAVAGPSGYNNVDEEGPSEAACGGRCGGPNKRWKFATAYFNFLADFRRDHKGEKWTPVEVARKAGEAWRNLSADQKKPYHEAAQLNRKTLKRTGRKVRRVRGRRAAGRRTRRHYDTDSETDTSSLSYYERPTKRRRVATTSRAKGTKGAKGSCICDMRHFKKGGKTATATARVNTLGGRYISDASSAMSEYSDY